MVICLYMKNSLMVPVVFVISYILCLTLVSIFAALGSFPVLNALVLGNYGHFFIAFAYRVLYYNPFCLMLALFAVFLFLMRHQSVYFVSVPLVVLAAVLSVVLFIPFSYQILDRFSEPFAATEEYIHHESAALQAAGSIRRDSASLRAIWLSAAPDASSVFSLITVNDAVRPGVSSLSVIPSAEFDQSSGSLVSGGTVIVADAGGSQGLLSTRLQAPSFIRSTGRDISAVLDSFRLAAAVGARDYYLLAGAFFAAVCVLWVFCHATGWRLLNALLAATVFRLLFLAWPYTRSGLVPDTIGKILPSSIDGSLICPGLYLAGSGLFFLAGLIMVISRTLARRKGGFNG